MNAIFTIALVGLSLGATEQQITQRVVPGRAVIPSYTQAYEAHKGQRYLVNKRHELPADMVVQGDTIELTLGPKVTTGMDQTKIKSTWAISQACGKPELTVDPNNPLVARFRADAYGVNEISVNVTDGQTMRQLTTNIYCEFSTGEAIAWNKQDVAFPKDYQKNLYIEEPGKGPSKLTGHRESMTARNPKTGRLVMVWWARGTVIMQVSDDHGITWKEAKYLLRKQGYRSGWGAICWNPLGNGGQGEFLLWGAMNTRKKEGKPNELLQYRSRDNAKSWQLVGNFTKTFQTEFGREEMASTYFGGNRMVVSQKGTIVAAMVCDQYVRAVWSDDNGATWHSSNIDDTFPQGNEDALIETLDGSRLILFARKPAREKLGRRRFESNDGGRTWQAKPDSPVPSTIVNLGLCRVDEAASDWHGRIIHSAATLQKRGHDRYRLVISVNCDISTVSEDKWDSRTLLNYGTGYCDVLYLPEDKSLLVTAETWPFGLPYTGGSLWGNTPMTRYFKLSTRYFQHLPKYNPDEQPNLIPTEKHKK